MKKQIKDIEFRLKNTRQQIQLNEENIININRSFKNENKENELEEWGLDFEVEDLGDLRKKMKLIKEDI